MPYVTALLLILIILVAGIVDVVATWHDEPTVSNIISEWSTRFPILAVSIGVMIGHLFWPNSYRRRDIP